MFKQLHINEASRNVDFENETIIGPWCLSSDFDVDVEKYLDVYIDPWDCPTRVSRETQNLHNLLDECVFHFYELFFQKYNIPEGIVFFRPLLINWIGPILSLVHERKIQLEAFLLENTEEKFVYECVEVASIQLETTGCAAKLARNKDFSAHVISLLIKRIQPKNLSLSQTKKVDKIFIDSDEKKPKGVLQYVRSLARQAFYGASISPYFPLTPFKNILAVIFLTIYSRALARSTDLKPKQKCDAKFDRRKDRKEDISFDVVIEICKRCLPDSLNENFFDFYNATKIKASKETVLVFVQYPDAFYEDRLFLNAYRYANGKKVFYQQHGCAYDSNPIFCHFHQIEFEKTGFISWGWTLSAYCKKLGQPLPMPLVKRSGNSDGGIMYVTKGSRPEKTLFVGDLRPASYSSRDQKRRKNFLGNLSSDTRLRIVQRPQQTQYDIAKAIELRDLGFIGAICEKKVYKFHKLLKSSSLVFLDHYGTTFYFCLAWNIPVICHWTKFPLLNFSYEETLEEFSNVGIVHYSAFEAANFYNKLTSIDDWWTSSEVQSVRRNFTSKYFLNNRFWLRKWTDFIKLQYEN
jgi:putative transferase (TIGR04331 family)